MGVYNTDRGVLHHRPTRKITSAKTFHTFSVFPRKIMYKQLALWCELSNIAPSFSYKISKDLALWRIHLYNVSVSKVVPPKRTILKDISLCFFPGAKIGVLGLNGAGKSTLLRTMAADKDFDGEAAHSREPIRYLPQEPQLNQKKPYAKLLKKRWRCKERFNSSWWRYAAYAEEGADFDALAKEQGELEALIATKDGHNQIMY